MIVDEFTIHCRFLTAINEDSGIFFERFMPCDKKYVARISLKAKRNKN